MHQLHRTDSVSAHTDRKTDSIFRKQYTAIVDAWRLLSAMRGFFCRRQRTEVKPSIAISADEPHIPYHLTTRFLFLPQNQTISRIGSRSKEAEYAFPHIRIQTVKRFISSSKEIIFCSLRRTTSSISRTELSIFLTPFIIEYVPSLIATTTASS